MTQYATMVGNICLDKAVDSLGNPAPVTFTVWQVMNGSMFPGHNNRDRQMMRGLETLPDAVKHLHSCFIAHLGQQCNHGSFWKENYQAARSKWQTWAKKQKHSFAYDNYSIRIVTSAGKIVY